MREYRALATAERDDFKATRQAFAETVDSDDHDRVTQT
jgi:hypothetical protein